MAKKLGLALSSGGARGAAHIGFLQALEENGIVPSYISGSSMGALVGACYAAGMSPRQMRDELFKLKTRDLLDLDILPFKKPALFKSVKIRELISRVLDGKSFENLNIPFTCVAVNILNCKEVYLNKGNLIDSVIASCSIPVLFKPVELDGMLLSDGGLADRVPIKAASDMGADVVVGVDALGCFHEIEGVDSLIGAMLRTIDIMDCRATTLKKSLESNITDLWIEVEMGAISQYNIKNAKEAYEAGLKCGYENIDAIKKLLLV